MIGYSLDRSSGPDIAVRDETNDIKCFHCEQMLYCREHYR